MTASRWPARAISGATCCSRAGAPWTTSARASARVIARTERVKRCTIDGIGTSSALADRLQIREQLLTCVACGGWKRLRIDREQQRGEHPRPVQLGFGE